MFEGKSILDILQLGGATMYVLLLCSVISITIFLERIIYYRKQSRLERSVFMAEMGEVLERGEMERAGEMAAATMTPYARVIQAGLKVYGRSEKVVSRAMDRVIVEETKNLEHFTGIVGTIGNIGVYIGLLGTVLGIVHAFHDIAMAGSGGMSTVIEGVAEALVCTATGLFVAIPAVIFFNYFMRRIEGFDNDMQTSASELLDLMEEKR